MNGPYIRTALARRALKIVLAATLAVATTAHAQLRLHDPGEEKTANTIRDGLATAKTNHLAAIDQHRTFLQEALARQRTLLVQRELAQRNAMVAEIIETQDATDRPGDELRTEIGFRLSAITGLREDNLQRFRASGSFLRAAERLDLAQHTYDQEAARLALEIRVFVASGGRGRYCEANGLPAPVMEAAGTSRDGVNNIRRTCSRMNAKINEMAAIARGLGPEAAAILGRPVAVAELPVGEMKDALEEAAGLTRLVGQQRLLTKAAADHLKDLERHYRCQVSRAAEPGAAARIEAAAQRIQQFTDWLANLDTQSFRDGLGANPQAAQPEEDNPCEDAETGEPAPRPADGRSSAALVASARLDPDQVLAAINAIGTDLDPVRSLLAGIHEEAQKFKSTKLSDLLGAVAGMSSSGDSQADQIAHAAFLLIDNIDQFRRARAGTLPDTAGVLVRLAGARMSAASARIESARLQQMKRLADLRVMALRREATALVAAYRLLEQSSGTSIDRALLRYSDSWAQGRMPSRIISHDMRSVQYLAWIDREKVAVEAAYGVLEPAVAQLQEYGAGGFTAAEIAQFLNVLGLGAIAVGR